MVRQIIINLMIYFIEILDFIPILSYSENMSTSSKLVQLHLLPIILDILLFHLI